MLDFHRKKTNNIEIWNCSRSIQGPSHGHGTLALLLMELDWSWTWMKMVWKHLIPATNTHTLSQIICYCINIYIYIVFTPRQYYIIYMHVYICIHNIACVSFSWTGVKIEYVNIIPCRVPPNLPLLHVEQWLLGLVVSHLSRERYTCTIKNIAAVKRAGNLALIYIYIYVY